MSQPHKVAGLRHRHHLAETEVGKPAATAAPSRWKPSPISPTSYSFGEVRVAHEQNLVLPHVRRDELFRRCGSASTPPGSATPTSDLITDIIACPGLDYCSLANARSIPVAQRIAEHFADRAPARRSATLKIKISGCINACGHHHVGHIGILGVDKNGEEFYQITLGGDAGNDAAIGTIVGPAVKSDEVPAADRYDWSRLYMKLRQDGERFPDTYRRVGQAPFKEALYAPR